MGWEIEEILKSKEFSADEKISIIFSNPVNVSVDYLVRLAIAIISINLVRSLLNDPINDTLNGYQRSI